jgi:hypothetical protein
VRAAWDIEGRNLALTLRPDAEDALTSPHTRHLRMLTNRATVKVPFDVPDPHPDLLALAAFSIASPWTARRLRLNGPSSQRMRDAFALAGIELSGTGETDPREPGTRPVLSYSGGADSIAAAELLPEGTPHVHLLRIKHPRVPNRMTHVRGYVLKGLALEAAERGRDVSVIETDLEYLCLPWATFPTGWSIAIGPILLADHYDGDAIVVGTTLEGRYLAEDDRWIDSRSNSGVHSLFAAAGIPLMQPVSGMSEIMTARMSAASDLADLARSCLLGYRAGPCLVCEKCLRKEMVNAAVTGQPLPRKLIANMNEHPKMMAKITAPPPIFLQNVMEYALVRLDVSGTPLQEVKDRLQPTIAETEWMERYYAPALEDEVPEQFRPSVVTALEGRIEMMTEADMKMVEAWGTAAETARP